jgi:hypothetical protein
MGICGQVVARGVVRAEVVVVKVSAGSHVQVVTVSDGRALRVGCRVASITASTMVLVPTAPVVTLTSAHQVDLVHEGRTWRQGVVVGGRDSFTIWRPADLDGDDARQTSRTVADLPATVRTDDDRYRATVEDISARGCRVRLDDRRLEVGDVVVVDVRGIELLATVMSSTSGGSGDSYGLAFERATVETQGRLFRLIGELRVAARLAALPPPP